MNTKTAVDTSSISIWPWDKIIRLPATHDVGRHSLLWRELELNKELIEKITADRRTLGIIMTNGKDNTGEWCADLARRRSGVAK